MSRRWRIAVVVVVVFVGAVAMWNLHLVIVRPRLCINQERCERIRVGMTRDEVIAHLVLPPGDFTNTKHPFRATRGYDLGCIVLEPAEDSTEEWSSDEGLIRVGFADGQVVHRCFSDFSHHSSRDWSEILQRLFARRP